MTPSPNFGNYFFLSL